MLVQSYILHTVMSTAMTCINIPVVETGTQTCVNACHTCACVPKVTEKHVLQALEFQTLTHHGNHYKRKCKFYIYMKINILYECFMVPSTVRCFNPYQEVCGTYNYSKTIQTKYLSSRHINIMQSEVCFQSLLNIFLK